jgi:hypothetical protein
MAQRYGLLQLMILAPCWSSYWQVCSKSNVLARASLSVCAQVAGPLTGLTMLKNRVPLSLGLILLVCLICGGLTYSRYIDWPSFGAKGSVRFYIPDQFPISDTHHYTYSNFMDTWELYRFTTTPEAISYLATELNLASPATVHEFPLIISRPPPYWWHPELLPDAQLYRSAHRASDGHLYDLLYSPDSGIAFLVRFDG